MNQDDDLEDQSYQMPDSVLFLRETLQSSFFKQNKVLKINPIMI